MNAILAVWDFLAGSSARTPIALGIAVAATIAMERAHAPSAAIECVYAGVIAAGLTLAAFESP